jgi:hypothetical protein
LVAGDWMEQVRQKKYDFFLCRPPGRVAYYKQLYDERVFIINKIMGFPVYPAFNEQIIYENKRLLSYFLKANNIPHPETWVFYNKKEAENFIKSCKLPIVGKSSIGASGSGVKIFYARGKALKYVEDVFSRKGVARSFLPNLRKGDYLKRGLNRLNDIGETVRYFSDKKNAATVDPQKWFVLFQKYIKVDYEWRCVVVNDSFFGHKKIRSFGEKISGTSNVSWDVPDKELLDFVKKIVVDNHFWSQAIDLFYDAGKGYLVNELQCFFGSKNPHQMINKGKPGRFVMQEGKWAFEEGIFNQNNSYDLRLQHVFSLLENR